MGDGGVVFMVINLYGGFQRSGHWQILWSRSKVEVWLEGSKASQISSEDPL